MSDGQEIKFLGEVQKLQLSDRDILVVKVNCVLTCEQHDRVSAAIRAVFGADRKLLVIGSDTVLSVISPPV